MHGRPAAVVVFAWAVLFALPAVAADQLLSGKKLLLRNPSSGINQAVHLARDPGVTVGNAGGAGDPQCSGAGGGGTSSLHIAAAGGAGNVVIPLPCANWSTNGANTVYRYRDPSGATCRRVIVKHHVLVKAVCSGPQVGIDVGSGMDPVAVATTLNSERYCTAFGGTIVRDGADGTTFLAKDAPAAVACPETTTTSTSTSTSTTAPTFCCSLPGRCGFSNPQQPEFCETAGGTNVADAQCDGGTGGCVAGSAVAGPCCQTQTVVPSTVGCVAGPSVNSGNCMTSGGSIRTFFASAVCTTGGTCQP